MPRVREIDRVHRARQNAVLDVDHQVVMRRHEAVLQTGPTRPLDGSREVTEELELVDVIAIEARHRPDAVRIDVERSCSDVSWFRWHGATLADVSIRDRPDFVTALCG